MSGLAQEYYNGAGEDVYGSRRYDQPQAWETGQDAQQGRGSSFLKASIKKVLNRHSALEAFQAKGELDRGDVNPKYSKDFKGGNEPPYKSLGPSTSSTQSQAWSTQGVSGQTNYAGSPPPPTQQPQSGYGYANGPAPGQLQPAMTFPPSSGGNNWPPQPTPVMSPYQSPPGNYGAYHPPSSQSSPPPTTPSAHLYNQGQGAYASPPGSNPSSSRTTGPAPQPQFHAQQSSYGQGPSSASYTQGYSGYGQPATQGFGPPQRMQTMPASFSSQATDICSTCGAQK